MASKPSQPPRRGVIRTLASTRTGLALLLLGALLVLAALVVPGLAMSKLMTASGVVAGASQLSRATVGDPVKVVVRLDQRAAGGSFGATLLQGSNSRGYQVTSTRLQLVMAGDLKVAMGDATDLRPGAVIEADGVVGSGDTITVHQAVVLTGFVRVNS